MTHPALIERITRSLAYMLRHQPEQFDLELDEFGWADLRDKVFAFSDPLSNSGWLVAQGQLGAVGLSTSDLRPDALDRYLELMERVRQVGAGDGQLEWAAQLVAAKDAPVLAAAVMAGAEVLVTGDLKHFGHLMTRRDLPLRVETVRMFLLEGPGPRA